MKWFNWKKRSVKKQKDKDVSLDEHIKAKDKALEENQAATKRVSDVVEENGFTMEIFASFGAHSSSHRGGV